ncbi:hypothetical protein HORIV_55740 [Vreelandella olivaria]|uniref:ATP-polyphosphate phosphotransferase n=1 Tax=Vreelandella olivaria TaxID=390919 RepID=A0ABN5X1N7_9GAMM|nr:hypothetical protein HORIV_55740 [Halomonas olivaria]
MTNFLLRQFELESDDLYRVKGPVNLTRMMSVLGDVDRPELLYRPFTPSIPKALKAGSLFDAIAKNDILLHHPFQSFTPIEDLLREAARDPHVLAVKQTLYRTGADSAIVNALVEAASQGKEVTVVIELRARFDEADNLQLASRLQEAGAIVVYGIMAYKTHAKMLHIVRREKGELCYYAHLGTGNYHAKTAKLYTDYSLLTANKALCADVHKVFQQLSGMGRARKIDTLLHAPFTLHERLVAMIDREAQIARKGKRGHIIIKCNSLTEPKLIKALYRASQAGVECDLIIRGMCCLKPGVPGFPTTSACARLLAACWSIPGCSTSTMMASRKPGALARILCRAICSTVSKPAFRCWIRSSPPGCVKTWRHTWWITARAGYCRPTAAINYKTQVMPTRSVPRKRCSTPMRLKARHRTYT